ncbi:D-cysteine desulfhydrase family protein [Rhizobium leguminosarum]|uniref:D-cysteine desulfhydrase family protein n=1 Tax=Rhizobium leguminosarum TaxID=384 RepID=UPI001C9801B4|nr:D-cysteine desulfhydrase family protein [Rhizobium leguminosarum]MBY5603678.1 D-cysteine desulfhydrase family protein [Rhizobium leguminosarum]MBY5699288.1 D-cysteine desulfhydrase family protein [Rhizobium leguminosarum]
MSNWDLLNRFPRVRLMSGPTPIQRLDRLEEVLGEKRRGVSIWAKRDDLMELGGGGNKLRKLEFLIGQARSEGCDTLVVTGGVQSNFARLAAAACARTGLACEVVLAQMVPRETEIYQANGNVLLDGLFGARVHLLGTGDNASAFAAGRASEIATSGGKAFVGTLGGSTPVGALGYVDCAFEIAAQSKATSIAFDNVVIPNGSGGMHAGLAVGSALAGKDPSKVRAHTVLSSVETCVSATVEKVNAVFDLLGKNDRIRAEELAVDGAQLGGGYGMPTSDMVDAVRLVGRSEGLLLDPVYGGKAFAGLLSDIENEVIAPGSNVLFVMTGGSPGLYAYADALSSH